MLPKVLKNFNLFINGRGYAGRVDEISLPTLAIRTEEFQLGGLDTPLQMDMGMDKLECQLTLREYDPEVIKLLGLINGSNVSKLPGLVGLGAAGEGIGFTLRGGLSDESVTVGQKTDIDIIPVIVHLRGAVIELDFGQWKAGQNAAFTARLTLWYYSLNIDGDALIEIDVNNMYRKIDGVEQVRALKGTVF
ncbi:hypothetical protein AB835_03855 [Candidatus Endobugula sertula]|uniref:Phage major tail tube protein n=1 Tax=Candidatus Endobugula sertula TaxID=62101 RepID=A0A1D2QSB5_9GAMM|nr:hypothetical protein AB835_03855 [Candidatus Endobugula sertula]